MIAADEFLEYARVFATDRDYYGTARRFLREAEKKVTICCWISMYRVRRKSRRNCLSGEHLRIATGPQDPGIAAAGAAERTPTR